MMKELTDEEMRTMVNLKITQVYPKLLKDAQQISGYNFKTYGLDLLAFALEKFLCDKPIDYQYKVAVIHNKLPNYLGRAMSLYIRSSTSPFWHKYRKEAYNSRGVYNAEFNDSKEGKPVEYTPDHLNDEFDTPLYRKDLNECMLWAIGELHFYYRQLITDYYIHNMTYAAIHKKYNISVNSITQDIKKGHKLIKELCQP